MSDDKHKRVRQNMPPTPRTARDTPITYEEFVAAMNVAFQYVLEKDCNMKAPLHSRDDGELIGIVIISADPEDSKHLEAAFDVVEALHEERNKNGPHS